MAVCYKKTHETKTYPFGKGRNEVRGRNEHMLTPLAGGIAE